MKTLELLSCLGRNPGEFADRVAAILSARWESSLGGRPVYQTVGASSGLKSLIGTLGREIEELLSEPNLAQIEKWITERRGALPVRAPFAMSHNGDTLLGRLCYAVTRAIRPAAVVETGVCYGVTSAYLLAALDANGKGHLYSIDLPPLAKNGDDYVGWLVPRNLQHRWTLRRGVSSRLLGPLVAEHGPIDLFIHDSLHTYKNMKSEFETAWPALRDGGVLISDDVQGNSAFGELTQSARVRTSLIIQEKDKEALLGAAVKRQ